MTAPHTHALALPLADGDLEPSELQDNHLLQRQNEEYLGNAQRDAKKPKLPWWKTPSPWW